MNTPKLTIADIQALIASEYYFTAAEGVSGAAIDAAKGDAVLTVTMPKELQTITFCILTLKNGDAVTGEAFCADPSRFVREEGQRYAREAAVSKIWPMAIYAERERLALGAA